MGSRVLITGASGLLGSALLRTVPTGVQAVAQVRQRRIHGIWRERLAAEETLELNDDAAVKGCFQRHDFSAVIHTAARTNAGDCEEHPDEARRDNVEVTGRLIELCRQAARPLVLVSTDLVFDGQGAPYGEDAARTPLGVYGQTKCDAEDRAGAYIHGVTVRITLLLGRSLAGNRSTDEGLANAQRRGATVSLFHDEYRTPIHNVTAAQTLWELLKRGATGLFHLAGRTRVSRWDLGVALARRLRLPETVLNRTSLKDFTGRPPRPPDCSLKTEKLETYLGRRMPTLEEMLELPLGCE